MRPVLRGKISTTGLRVGAVAALAIASVASLAAMRSAPVAKAGGGCSPTVSRQFFGKTIEPYTGKNTAVYRYTLTNCRGTQVKILTYGGIVQSIVTPSRHGREADVVLGFKTLKDYVQFVSPPVIANGGPYFGETIGRYGNRIAKGTFKLNGKTYTLPLNNGANSLHGGLVGFGNHIWASKAVTAPGSAGVQLTLVSPNGDASGAPGSPGCPTGCTGYPAARSRPAQASRSRTSRPGCALRAGRKSCSTPRCSSMPWPRNQQPPRAASAAGLGISPRPSTSW